MGRVVKIHGCFRIQALRPEALLPAPVGARPLPNPSHPRAWAWATTLSRDDAGTQLPDNVDSVRLPM
jgi:hypothetical protein